MFPATTPSAALNTDRGNLSVLLSSPVDGIWSYEATRVTLDDGKASEGTLREMMVPATQPVVPSGSQIRVPLAYVDVMVWWAANNIGRGSGIATGAVDVRGGKQVVRESGSKQGRR